MTTFPPSHRDLLDAQVATLATIGGDGFPQLTEVWFIHEDGELKLSLNDSRLKTRNLRKQPKSSLMILDLENPYRYLVVRGTRSRPRRRLRVRRQAGGEVLGGPQACTISRGISAWS